MIKLLRSTRPKQWVKNLFIFAPLLFSENLFNASLVSKSVLAFISFCMLSGCVYIINDIMDLEKDKMHPIKRFRPLASGEVRVLSACIAATLLFLVSLMLAYSLDRNFSIIALVYFLLNLAYSIRFKHIVIVDVFIVATGFFLRVLGGAEVIHVNVSSWLLICTILLALFLAFSKRRHELVILNEEAIQHRKILAEYSPYFLDQMISVVTASIVVSYLLYTTSEETVTKFNTRALVLTVPFVLYGIFRYLYLVHQKEGGGNPTLELLNDKPLMFNMILWILTAGIIIYV
ncbi:MAG: decaprenyl-phosphate phosphoribosyltransferase [Candidatus Glassbacteria bacterium]